MDNTSEIGRIGDPPAPSLELVLLEEARFEAALHRPATSEFRCPDCAGDEPLCPTCGEPTRMYVDPDELDEWRAA